MVRSREAASRTMRLPKGFARRGMRAAARVPVISGFDAVASPRNDIGRIGCLKIESENTGAWQLKRQLPGFAHEIGAKAVVLFGGDLAEAGLLVDAACGKQDALRPQRDLPVTGLAR